MCSLTYHIINISVLTYPHINMPTLTYHCALIYGLSRYFYWPTSKTLTTLVLTYLCHPIILYQLTNWNDVSIKITIVYWPVFVIRYMCYHSIWIELLTNNLFYWPTSCTLTYLRINIPVLTYHCALTYQLTNWLYWPSSCILTYFRINIPILTYYYKLT